MPKILAITLFCLFSVTGLSSATASTQLEQSMKRMAHAYHQLDKDLKQPIEASKPDYLALVATMKMEAQNSRSLVPALVKQLPADQQAAQVTAYQKSIDDLSSSIDVLGQDITTSKWDEATKQIAALKTAMIDGHKKFRKPEEKMPVYKTITPDAAAPTPTPSKP